jgi:hypothetical protein
VFLLGRRPTASRVTTTGLLRRRLRGEFLKRNESTVARTQAVHSAALTRAYDKLLFLSILKIEHFEGNRKDDENGSLGNAASKMRCC